VRKFLIEIAISVVLGIIAMAPARAMTFDFSANSIGKPGDLTSGMFTASLSSPGIYTVTGITGTFDGVAITGLSTYANADNELFFPMQPYVDFQGISFHTAGLGDINLFSNAGYFEVKSTVDSVGYYFDGTPISLNVAVTPLPSTFPLFVAGLAVLGWLGWRGRKTQATMA
jgi:hypothetical protein